MATKEALAMRALRHSRLLQGTCIYCGRALETKTMCAEHAEKRRRSAEPLVFRTVKRYPVRRKSKRKGGGNS